MTPRRAAFRWVADVITASVLRRVGEHRSDGDMLIEVCRIRDAMRAASEVADVRQECPARPLAAPPGDLVERRSPRRGKAP